MAHDDQLQLNDFIYDLPDNLIAQVPLPDRESSKLLVRHCDGRIEDSSVKALTAHIPEGALLVVNDSRVIASRLLGLTPTGGKAEIMLLEPVPSASGGKNLWWAIGKPLKKFHVGYKIDLGNALEATIQSEPEIGPEVKPFQVAFNMTAPELEAWLETNAYIPLPPYIARPNPKPANESGDRDRYQTVYANLGGSVAAPTAGLHFTEGLLERLSEKGVTLAKVTLHVGAGTFMPVKVQDLSAHTMHEERYLVTRETIQKIIAARAEKRPVIAVGTTTLRCLEALRQDHPNITDLTKVAGEWRRTSLFLRPKKPGDRYQPWSIDGLMTNFHQPGSTLFMLISALVGLDAAKETYRHAIAQKYRFLSYGDSCLFWLKEL